MDETKARAYDLQRAAVHEAGHAAVAAHYGVETCSELRRNPAGGRGEAYVLGRTWMLDELPAPQAAVLIALAGAVAEAIAEAGVAVTADEIAEGIAAGDSHFSEADAAAAGVWTIADVMRCIGLVLGAWPEIEQRAAALAAGMEGRE